jgi:hypothetical protein
VTRGLFLGVYFRNSGSVSGTSPSGFARSSGAKPERGAVVRSPWEWPILTARRERPSVVGRGGLTGCRAGGPPRLRPRAVRRMRRPPSRSRLRMRRKLRKIGSRVSSIMALRRPILTARRRSWGSEPRTSWWPFCKSMHYVITMFYWIVSGCSKPMGMAHLDFASVAMLQPSHDSMYI